MLILFETSAGFAIFKLLDEKKLQKIDNLYKDFESPEAASKIVKLKHFEKFHDTTEALAAITANVEGKMSKSLKKLLKKLYAKEVHEELAVADAKLGNAIKEKLNLSCVYNNTIAELMRCIRSQIENLVSGLGPREISSMTLGLAHSLSRYKLKFSPEKVDTMIVQAISLLDDLDKELNNYIMRCREWYGWHFPELGKIVTDNLQFVKTVNCIGMRSNARASDLFQIVPEDMEKQIKDAADISMGTEISEEDIENIKYLCDQVIEITEYRNQLYQYLQHRMMAIAPNVTVLAGELVGARLISHAGSLMNLAKHPSSTVQILGAEKALFRALKTKHDTPKYGLIYHTSLVGQTNQKIKGKMSRMLAAKVALACRVDALGETTDCELGIEHKAKLERRLKQLEENGLRRISGTGKTKAQWDKYDNKSQIQGYNIGDDSTLPSLYRKREFKESPGQQEIEPQKKKIKLEPQEEMIAPEIVEEVSGSGKKKKKKRKSQAMEEEGDFQEAASPDYETAVSGKKKIKKEYLQEAETIISETPESSKKKKKKKKELTESEDQPAITEVKSELEEFSPCQFSQESSKKKKKKKKKEVQPEESY